MSAAYYPVKTQTVSLGGTSAATADAVGAGIFVVRLTATQDAHIEIGKSPTATTSSMRIAADEAEYFSIRPGEKVAGIEVSALTGGTVYITEMSQ